MIILAKRVKNNELTREGAQASFLVEPKGVNTEKANAFAYKIYEYGKDSNNYALVASEGAPEAQYIALVATKEQKRKFYFLTSVAYNEMLIEIRKIFECMRPLFSWLSEKCDISEVIAAHEEILCVKQECWKASTVRIDEKLISVGINTRETKLQTLNQYLDDIDSAKYMFFDVDYALDSLTEYFFSKYLPEPAEAKVITYYYESTYSKDGKCEMTRKKPEDFEKIIKQYVERWYGSKEDEKEESEYLSEYGMLYGDVLSDEFVSHGFCFPKSLKLDDIVADAFSKAWNTETSDTDEETLFDENKKKAEDEKTEESSQLQFDDVLNTVESKSDESVNNLEETNDTPETPTAPFAPDDPNDMDAPEIPGAPAAPEISENENVCDASHESEDEEENADAIEVPGLGVETANSNLYEKDEYDAAICLMDNGDIYTVDIEKLPHYLRGAKGKKIYKNENKDKVFEDGLEEHIKSITVVSSKDMVLVFTKAGKTYLKEAKAFKPDGNLIKVITPRESEDEQVTCISSLGSELPEDTVNLLMVTKTGKLKRICFGDIREDADNNGASVLLRDENGETSDEVVNCVVLKNNLDSVILSGETKACRIDEEQIPRKSLKTAALNGIILQEGEKLTGVSQQDKDKKSNLFTLSKLGYGKLTSFDDFEKRNRNSIGKYAQAITKNDDKLVLTGAVESEKDDILIITKTGRCLVFNSKELPVYQTTAVGVTCIKLDVDDYIVAAAVINTNN